ncbi:hypothetical protein [Cytobacillus sp. FSL H8-0458]|uniref:hypothetical protein n=1 Tax=Cytobacillus sp. FSL H8-0458 TaxID=2975346 RepID=UPI0030F7B415
MTNLSKQIFVYSLGTYCFHNEEENKIHKRITGLKGYKKRLTKSKDKLKSAQLSKKELKEKRKGINDEIRLVNEEIEKLKMDLHAAFNNHKGIRNLRSDELTKNNVISIFDSVLTRTLGLEEDELTEDIIVIQSFHFQVLDGLIKDGFVNHQGEQYVYFSSSAGQIRQKKGVWIKKDLWEKHKGSLTCGLGIDEINNSEKQGCNINKYLSYKALINSASEEWLGFDIDRCICVDDMDLVVNSEVDYINRDTYKIQRNIKMDVPVTVTDGVGMILPTVSEKNFMVRLPWIKGLLAVYDFRQHGTKVKDIDGVEWDIEKDDIQIIFTRSQFKMHSYFKSWADYKERFNKYKCQAAKLNEEEDELNSEGKINYQMLQSLVDVTDAELTEIAASTINDINSIGNDKKVMLKILGATETNERKRSFQRALIMYPELLNDDHSKQTIKNKKKSLVQDSWTGKLNVNGSFTFIIPDLYSFSEYLFKGKAKSLLKENEVFCRLHDSGRVGILRSPHLSREWGLKDNVIDEEKKQYFKTDAIYVSNESLLSKLIQNDWDGDKVLVLSENKDEKLLEVAERNMRNDHVVPLYYEMEKAPAQLIDADNIYLSLKAAFDTNGAIGEVSNQVTKVWNSDKPDLDVISWLCMESNFEIDYAKTLFRLTRPEHIEVLIKKYINSKMPHFFKFNKKKNKNKNGTKKKMRVEESNGSTVNKLEKIIPNKRITFKEVAGGSFDYKLLMKSKSVELDMAIIQRYKELDQNKKELLNAHNEDVQNKKGKLYVYKLIRDELLEVNSDEYYVTDVLIEHLYNNKKSRFKDSLWESFGEIIEENLEMNLNEALHCTGCNSKFRKIKQRQVRCEDCQIKRNREKSKLAMRKKRNSA